MIHNCYFQMTKSFSTEAKIELTNSQSQKGQALKNSRQRFKCSNNILRIFHFIFQMQSYFYVVHFQPVSLFVVLKMALSSSGFHDPQSQLYHQTQTISQKVIVAYFLKMIPWVGWRNIFICEWIHMAWKMDCPHALNLRPKSLVKLYHKIQTNSLKYPFKSFITNIFSCFIFGHFFRYFFFDEQFFIFMQTREFLFTSFLFPSTISNDFVYLIKVIFFYFQAVFDIYYILII